MAILGEIIKRVIDLKDALTPASNPIDEQKEVLKKLLEMAENTAFGKQYRFSTLLQSKQILKDFSEAIPYFDYDKINSEWWYKLHDGEENVTWPGIPDYYALSSGTTGKTSKKIPVTNEMITAIRDTGIAQVAALANFNLPAEFFEKGILMLGSSTDLTKKENHLEGEISGISASNIPFWFRSYYKPGEEIAQIEDWDERVQK
ncbi:MAG: GH3 auxin-responsive promoter family protein, partial [Cellulophaga sp.]|nr:GH3 auxin-responsive promoter family protein [Cellulophaga sp.]